MLSSINRQTFLTTLKLTETIMKTFRVYNKENKEVVLIYVYGPYFLYSGFSSEEEAKQTVINEIISKQSTSNDIETQQAYRKAKAYINKGSWIDITQLMT